MKHETLEKLCDMVSDELTKVTNKVEKTELSTGMLEYIDKLAHALKSIKTIMAMEDHKGSYDDGYSRRRTMGYSRDDKMISELRDLMGQAPEDTRHEFQRLISKMESM